MDAWIKCDGLVLREPSPERLANAVAASVLGEGPRGRTKTKRDLRVCPNSMLVQVCLCTLAAIGKNDPQTWPTGRTAG